MSDVKRAAIPMECSLMIKRDSKDGWCIGFKVHPDDIPEDILKLKLGTRFQLVCVPINDDETPMTPDHRAGREPDAEANPVVSAGQLCRNESFQNWMLRDHVTGDINRVMPDLKESATVKLIQDHCHISSRAELSTDKAAALLFWDLVENYATTQ